jgi:hypothetical protein
MKRAVVSLSISAAVAFVSCVVSVSDFAGKSCEVAEDCPDEYVCVAARPGAGRTCEVLGLPGLADAGGPPPGPVPTWCREVQPLMNSYCTSNCHGVDNSGSRQTGFRLDTYESTGSVKGAMEMAPRVEVRATRFKDMPPVGNPMPTEEERQLLGSWAAGGAPFCTDGEGSTDGGR